MRIFFIIFAVIAVPLVFFTMYLRTSQGIKQKLGSFFVIRKLKSDHLKVRSLKDIILLLIRLAFAVIIIVLIINPSDVENPGRNTIFHNSGKIKSDNAGNKFNFKFIAPGQATDKFDEDRFFLEAFVKNYKSKSGNISIIYNPSEKLLDSIKGDVIIFPHKKQAGNAFLKWIELFDFSFLRMKEDRGVKIKGTEIFIRASYPILIADSSNVKKLSELADGTVIAVSFAASSGRVLLFGAGVSAFWGDMGVSGYFADIINDFVNNISLSEKQNYNTKENIRKDNFSDAGEVKSLLSFDTMLKIASVVLLLELIFFIFRIMSAKKALPLIFILLFFSQNLYAEDFRFIELTMDGKPANAGIFRIIKRELEEKTSVRISPDYYSAHSASLLAQGRLPELPYLWIMGCTDSDALSGKVAAALVDFIERGGIIFVDQGGAGGGQSCRQFFNGIALRIAGSPGLVRLSGDHPVYKSFFLISSRSFSGADVSVTTKRTAVIISENDFGRRILLRDEAALKAGVNIVLYMLSGNYKSDQIHTRQILNRLKKRELFR